MKRKDYLGGYRLCGLLLLIMKVSLPGRFISAIDERVLCLLLFCHVSRLPRQGRAKRQVSNHHFKWWFANSPIRAEYMRRLKAGVASHSCFFRLKRPIRFLLFVHGFFGLTPDVFFHGFFVHVSDRRYIVPSGPKTSVPFTPQFWMLTEDHQRRLSFEIPHKI